MSMYPQELGAIPEETARVARAAWPKGTLAMRLRDALGELYRDEQFAALYPVEGQPAYEPFPNPPGTFRCNGLSSFQKPLKAVCKRITRQQLLSFCTPCHPSPCTPLSGAP